MDAQLSTTIVSTGGAVIVGLGGMWIATNQVGKRIDDIARRMDRLETKMDRLDEALGAFKDIVNSKLATLDLEIARILDKIK